MGKWNPQCPMYSVSVQETGAVLPPSWNSQSIGQGSGGVLHSAQFFKTIPTAFFITNVRLFWEAWPLFPLTIPPSKSFTADRFITGF